MTGPIEPDSLGAVMTHEHLLMDFKEALTEAKYGINTNLADLTFELKNLGKIRQFP